MSRQRYRLKFTGALGDIVAMTAVVRDLVLCNTDVEVEVETPFPDVFQYNQRITNWRSNDAIPVEISEQDYRDAVQASRMGLRHHFIRFFHDVVARKTGLPCTLTSPRPELFLSPFEKNIAPISGSYWLLFAGGKQDITIKHWEPSRYQQLVTSLVGVGIQVVQTGRANDAHRPVANALNLIGWGKVRELFSLIYHAEGVICPVTCGMHIAAAFNRPCVVIAGGREEPWWEAYSNEFDNLSLPVREPHRYLHTLGKLDCCKDNGCWLKQVENCLDQVVQPGRMILPRCMDMISVSDVLAAVLSYYPDGVPMRFQRPLVDRTREGGCASDRCLTKPLPQGVLPRFVKLGNQSLDDLRAEKPLGGPQQAPGSPIWFDKVSEAMKPPERPKND